MIRDSSDTSLRGSRQLSSILAIWLTACSVAGTGAVPLAPALTAAERASLQPQLEAAMIDLRAGRSEPALTALTGLAERGLPDAMLVVGFLHYEGRVIPRSYDRALDWFLRAHGAGQPDALHNVAVMFRDGQGVPVDKKIAYDLFLLIHLRSMGAPDQLARARGSLRALIEDLTPSERNEARCYTEAYVYAYALSRGRLESPPPTTLPAPGRPRIKDDAALWSDEERAAMGYACPPPWSGAG